MDWNPAGSIPVGLVQCSLGHFNNIEVTSGVLPDTVSTRETAGFMRIRFAPTGQLVPLYVPNANVRRTSFGHRYTGHRHPAGLAETGCNKDDIVLIDIAPAAAGYCPRNLKKCRPG